MFRLERLNIITDIIKGNYQKIEVIPGYCRYNFHCHSNAVHDAISNKENRIAMVVYFDGDHPICHFINVNSNDDYIDNTLGHWSSRMEYYHIRYIDEIEFWDVYNIHKSFRKTIKMQLPFVYRLLHSEDFI